NAKAYRDQFGNLQLRDPEQVNVEPVPVHAEPQLVNVIKPVPVNVEKGQGVIAEGKSTTKCVLAFTQCLEDMTERHSENSEGCER
ncbi:hypothetical protein E4U58_006718, partial [Claviceps cyperi]